jgi:DNA-binding NarL/FixJ family response regulator
MSHSVLIIEDDLQFRAAFADAIACADDLHLAGMAGDLPEGLRLLEQTKPDVLLVDIGLPSGSGIQLIRSAQACLPNCDVMVVTVFGDEHHVLECIEAGATGYLLKDSKGIDIVEQIRSLREGGSPISPSIARRLLKCFVPKNESAADKAAQDVSLSDQEQRVLSLSAKGYNYEEVAGLLGVSRNTVGTYVKRVYRKLQVHSKTEAVYEARKLGLMHD